MRPAHWGSWLLRPWHRTAINPERASGPRDRASDGQGFEAGQGKEVSTRSLLPFVPPDQQSPLPLVADALDALAATLRAFAGREVRVPEETIEYLRVPSVAKVLGISESQVRTLIRAKKLHAVRFGKRDYSVASTEMNLYVRRRNR